jgi:hypothetical protein
VSATRQQLLALAALGSAQHSMQHSQLTCAPHIHSTRAQELSSSNVSEAGVHGQGAAREQQSLAQGGGGSSGQGAAREQQSLAQDGGGAFRAEYGPQQASRDPAPFRLRHCRPQYLENVRQCKRWVVEIKRNGINH